MEENQEPQDRKLNDLRFRLKSGLHDIPCYLLDGVCWLFYRYRYEGKKNVPADGPYIAWVAESSPLGLPLAIDVCRFILKRQIHKHPDRVTVLAFFQEELFKVPAVKQAVGDVLEVRGLVPHSAAGLAQGMLDGYRMLQKNGVVFINPQGDVSWDGRPLPFGRSMAWLALRSGAPISPSLLTCGVHEVWPRWQRLPSRKGRIKTVAVPPLKLVDQPLERVTDQDLDRAQARIKEWFEEIHYGPGGLEAWIGPVLRDGVEITEPVQLRPPSTPLAAIPPSTVKVNRRGVAQLLWQCPVCRADDALLHRRPRFRRETVLCQACGTLWEFQRLTGHDFRMKVVEGPPELVGLDMALSTWYEHMKNNFCLRPIEAAGVDLLPGEEVYLEAGGVTLSPYRPNALYEGWTEREAPKKQSGWLAVAGWESLGEGRLLATSHRVLWQGAERELDFLWTEVTAVSQYLASTLALNYGSAKYRFRLGDVFILKWLHHMGVLATQAAARQGRSVIVSAH